MDEYIIPPSTGVKDIPDITVTVKQSDLKHMATAFRHGLMLVPVTIMVPVKGKCQVTLRSTGRMVGE